METANHSEPRPQTVYPDAFTVSPKSGNHKQTFILLHGGGQDGDEFSEILKTSIPEYDSLPDAYPDAQFIFPTAAEQYAAGLGYVNRQWFDLFSAGELDEKDDFLVDGLHESVNYIHTILERAIAEVGPQNVFMGGLSQGCALTVLSALLWEGPPFAAAFGIAGWVPFRKRIETCWELPGSGEPLDHSAKLQKCLTCLRETVDISANTERSALSCIEIPIFIGHGVEDDGLLLSRARPTHNLLLEMGLRVKLRDYDGLGHWWSGEMLRDIVDFITSRGRPMVE